MSNDDDSTVPVRPGSPRKAMMHEGLPSPDWRAALKQPFRYSIGEEIASGGMGEIRLAKDALLGRNVAQKRVLPALADRDEFTELLVAEASITAKLEHPNVVPVHDLGLDENGQLYFSMQLIEGRTLKEWIGQTAWEDVPSWNDVLDQLDAVMKVCDAVTHAHSLGVLHRDIKPSNIVVGEHGQVYLMDWGVAKDSDQVPSKERKIVGTLAYMSPEQAKGEALDVRADVFSLGALIFEILCGKPPFGADSYGELLAKVRAGQAPTPKEVQPSTPGALSAIVARAMASNPAKRYSSASALKNDLVQFLRGGEVFEQIRLPAGSVIIREGEEGDTAYILEAGRCTVSVREKIIREIEAGEVFGEMALLGSGIRSATVEAIGPVVLRKIGGESFLEEVSAMKPWMGALLRSLASRLERATP